VRGVRVAAGRAHDLVPDPGDVRAERVVYLRRARLLGPVWVFVGRAEMREICGLAAPRDGRQGQYGDSNCNTRSHE